jgi:hypothetical protein
MSIFDRLFGDGPASPGHLERALVRFNQERSAASQGAALELLLKCKLFVPSIRPPEEAAKQLTFIVEETQHGPTVLTFTAPERMDSAEAARVKAQSGLMVESTWLLAAMPDEFGLQINPGLASGLLLPAAGLAAFKRSNLPPRR